MREKAWALTIAAAVFVAGVVWLRAGGSDSDFLVYALPALVALVVGLVVYLLLHARRD